MSRISDVTPTFNRQGLVLAIVAVSAFATSAIFVRWAAPLSAYEITFWRMLIGSAIVFLFAVVKQPLPSLRRGDVRRFIGFGLITALHFLGYNASLQYTTIAHSLTIVFTAPVFVALFSRVFLGEVIIGRKWVGIIVVVLGVALMAGFEPAFDTNMLLGDALALLSAVTFGLYSVAGRSQRARYPLFTYAFFVYFLAALWMAPTAALAFTSGGYGLQQILSLLAMGIIPLGIGHTLYNAALRRMSATYVNLIASQELTGGILLGVLLLGEIPPLSVIPGIVITLVGIVLVLL